MSNAKLKASLTEWLWLRGEISKKRSIGYSATEQRLGKHLQELLTKAGVAHVPKDPETLARLVIADKQSAQGILPFIIVGAVLIGIMQITSSIADQAKLEAELKYCRLYPNSSRCQKFDWGKWMTIGVLGVGSWFLWTKTTVLKGFKKK